MGSNPTLSAIHIDIIEQFGIFDIYAQASVQSIFDDTDTIGLVVLVVALAAFFIAYIALRFQEVRPRLSL